MKTKVANAKCFILLNLIVSAILVSCSPSAEEKSAANNYAYSDALESVKQDSMSTLNSSAVIMATKDSSHVFMRNADIKFSVKDVRAATSKIEQIIRKHNGFIIYTNLAGTRIKNNSLQITEDSLINEYNTNVWNEITLRVPNVNLDSTLIEMDKLVEFLDSRTITADDVKLKLIASQLNTKRNQIKITKLDKTIEKQGKKLPETIEGINTLDYTMLNQDEQHLNLLDLKEKVAYSTVKLYIYQPESILFEKALAPIKTAPFKPSFGSKLNSAFETGYVVIQAIVLFFAAIWPLITLFIVVWLISKWLIRTKLLSKLFKI